MGYCSLGVDSSCVGAEHIVVQGGQWVVEVWCRWAWKDYIEGGFVNDICSDWAGA